MKRKIMKIADTTYVVSLPLKWARKYGVQKGDEVDVEEKGNNLLVKLQKTQVGPGKIRVNLKGMGFFTTRIIASLYKDGFDEIEIEHDDPEHLKTILNQYFIGYEIVKFDKGVYTIKAISEIIDSEIEPMFRRTFILLKSMGNDFYQAVKNKDEKSLLSIKASEESNNRFTSFLRRALMKKELYDAGTRILKYILIEEMEKLADEYKYLCTYLLGDQKRMKINQGELSVIEGVASMVQDFYDLYFGFSMESAKKIAQKRKGFVTLLHAQFESKDVNSMRVAHYLINIVQSLANMVSFRISMHFLEEEHRQAESLGI